MEKKYIYKYIYMDPEEEDIFGALVRGLPQSQKHASQYLSYLGLYD